MIALERRIVRGQARGQAQEGGYRRLRVVGGEPRQVRTELVGAGRPPGERRPLLAFAHLSDLHVMDHQSPGRVELLLQGRTTRVFMTEAGWEWTPGNHERWWVDDDGVTVRDENRLIVAVAAGPEDAELIARAPRMRRAIQHALERLEHEDGAPLHPVIGRLKAALTE